MLFNSYEFLFAFLPATLLLFFLAGRVSRDFALGWLIVASLVFYAWWRPVNVPIIAASLAVNFTIARLLQRFAADRSKARLRGVLLAFGIIFNVVYLGYFKYTNFLLGALNDVTGTQFALTQIILPLGLSFITFQKIAFLIDVNSGRVESFTLRDYLLFVLFFPQLIAGPIVHYREMMPQFHQHPCRFDRRALAVGLTMVCFGLFKKVVLADGLAAFVTPVYLQATHDAVSLFPAWLAAIGFTLQIYFDFSGYSDMAAGIALCFGVRLPLNFYSPLQASSIIDFWTRWHVTLSRFLTAYLYNPMLLAITRRRFARGLPGLGGHKATPGAFLQLLAGPLLVTMFISGIWHGAGYLFMVWGLLHGLYLTIDHGWRLLGHRLMPDKARYEAMMRPIGFVITFLAVVLSMVFFRAPTLRAAMTVLAGMSGLHGIELPRLVADRIGAAHLPHFVAVADSLGLKDFLQQNLWLLGLLFIALVMPNSIQILRSADPVLGAQERPANTGLVLRSLSWQPTPAWALFMALLAAAAVMRMGGPSEFLYWQF
jgi:D-alanyl-lipoteichoic acid acyltransferase DltB (MBOAT superfamily)